ncbi:MAG: tetratricopeptide repeat protein [Candidatus Acidiferrum sp.]
MPASNHSLLPRLGSASALLATLLLGCPLWGQTQTGLTNTIMQAHQDTVLVKVRVLDEGGLPLDNPAQVRIFSIVRPVNLTASTQQAIAAITDVQPGDYEIEVSSPGFKKSTQHLHVVNLGDDFSVFVYMHFESESDSSGPSKSAVPVKPKLQGEINKGLELYQKKRYEKAYAEFAKASNSAPENPNLWYLQGTAELSLQRKDAARKDFEQALSLDPTHEKTLLAIAQLQLDAGETSQAIKTLEKVYRNDGAGWRTHYLLASAMAQDNRFPDAEDHAIRAANLAGRDGAPALMLLADIQYHEGKKSDARRIWARVSTQFPGSAAAAEAKARSVKTAGEPDQTADLIAGSLPLRPLPEPAATAREEVVWAPPDVDSREYQTATAVTCKTEEVLDLAQNRLNSQLRNFEKFTATEHVVHQEIDRDGVPSAPKEKDFSYIVFVFPYGGNSLYLEESRDGGIDYSAFPTPVVTTGLNSLGVSVLQPANRKGFIYKCEGLTSLRGQAAWQIRFEEKKDSTVTIRRWQRNKTAYNLPLKGRIWVSSATYDMLQIETDLREPVRELGLTRDHLQVKYGPVSFQDGKQWLWLPWGAEMYMEYGHRRYHHQHFLTNYMLFGVDTNEKVHNPKAPPPDPEAPS